MTSDDFWITILKLASVPLLVLLNGFFVAAEFALVKIRDTQLETLVPKVTGAPGLRGRSCTISTQPSAPRNLVSRSRAWAWAGWASRCSRLFWRPCSDILMLTRPRPIGLPLRLGLPSSPFCTLS